MILHSRDWLYSDSESGRMATVILKCYHFFEKVLCNIPGFHYQKNVPPLISHSREERKLAFPKGLLWVGRHARYFHVRYFLWSSYQPLRGQVKKWGFSAVTEICFCSKSWGHSRGAGWQQDSSPRLSSDSLCLSSLITLVVPRNSHIL